MNRIGIFARAIVLALIFAALAAIPAHAITRDSVVARGRVWTDRHVAYSQSGWANEAGTIVSSSSQGWRRDCSGFVSMSLNLRYSDGRPLSLDTASLPSVLEKITKDELMPGDVISRSRLYVDPATGKAAPYGHAMVFVEWANPEHTYMYIEHSSGSNNGAVYQKVPYPFWPDGTIGTKGYYPYRYENIEDDFADVLDKVSGSDRYATAVEASKLAFPEGATAPSVVIASGRSWPDALGGSALAGAAGGPLLLTDTSSLPAATAAEIKRLAPDKAYILGGESVVTDRVAGTLGSLGCEVVRLGGRSRYDTSALVAGEAVRVARASGRTVDAAFIATGADFPDALAASPLSAHTARPVLLTDPDVLSSEALGAIDTLGLDSVTVLGGVNCVSASVEASLAATGANVTRIAERDRYRTALAIAEEGERLGLTWEHAAVASGTSFADALSGGAAQGLGGSLLVLTPGDSLNPNVETVLLDRAAEIGRPRVLGGLGVLSQNLREDLAVIFRSLVVVP